MIPKERAAEYCQIQHSSPYMMHAVLVQEKKAEEIAATVHVDGTCRMQTVNKHDLLKFYALLLAFEKTAGIPVILNASLNIKAQPVVETSEEALQSFQSTNIDGLVLQDFVIEK